MNGLSDLQIEHVCIMLRLGFGLQDIGVRSSIVTEAEARSVLEDARRNDWIGEIYPKREKAA